MSEKDKPKSFKVKVGKLTFAGGKQYLPGEVVEFTGVEAEIAAAHYGKAVTPKADPQADAAAKQAEAVRQAKANSSQGGE